MGIDKPVHKIVDKIRTGCFRLVQVNRLYSRIMAPGGRRGGSGRRRRGGQDSTSRGVVTATKFVNCTKKLFVNIVLWAQQFE